MFKPLPPSLNINQMEEGVLRAWKRHRIFEKARELHPAGQPFVLYEAPATANRKPALQDVVTRLFKDATLRYKTMNGYRVSHRGGWSTHGLGVEFAVEEQLGFNTKSQIETYGLDRFNDRCRKSIFTYVQDWERLTERTAAWVDLQDAYVTHTAGYIQSVWWGLKSLWEKEQLYQSVRVVPYCPRCGTPLSGQEVSMGYREAVEPSIYVRLPLIDEPGTSLLIWTTSPWTLPGNVAVAAHPDQDYVIVERDLPEGDQERLILAKNLVPEVFEDQPIQVYESFKGRKLKDLRYRPLFTFLLPEKKSHYVIMGEYVDMDEGTGLVHIAPAFGEQDMAAAMEHDLPVLHTVTDQGTFIPEVRPWSGKFVKDVDHYILQDLHDRGLLFKAGTHTHAYPFCWCCGTPLLHFARSAWYLRTSQVKERMLQLNRSIEWIPEHVKSGRFGAWLENSADWMVAHERYWGTPLPVWECRDCHHQLLVGSLEELSERSEEDLSDLDLHRPAIDQVKLPCPECDGQMQRLPELVNAWFDAGSMPFAQWNYPDENRSGFKEQFPADLVCEPVNQTRGWFYALHAANTLLFGEASFKRALCLGQPLDDQGQILSASRENLIDPWEIIHQHGADALRWQVFTAAPPWEERRISMDQAGDIVRNFTLPLWNVYRFLITYARMDGWTPDSARPEPAADEPGGVLLDRWLYSRLHTLIRDVTAAFEDDDLFRATRPVQSFVDQLSKWYLRRSRRRFWRAGLDRDKTAAYAALCDALTTLSRLLAPTLPLFAEELYQNLVRSIDPGAPESVHLCDWPAVAADRLDPDLEEDMQLVIQLASLGHAARDRAGLKVRQPLSEAAFSTARAAEAEFLDRYAPILEDELNVKRVRSLDPTEEVLTYHLNPRSGLLGEKYQSRYPAVREAILKLDAGAAGRILQQGQPIQVVVGDDLLEIRPEEVEIRVEPVPGLQVASEGPYLAVLDTQLTPDLIEEGFAREFVRRVQILRKDAGLDIADRIRLYVSPSPRISAVVQAHRDYIQSETLAGELQLQFPPAGTSTSEIRFDDQALTFGLVKI
jgi:isoleucyl-tRNA synthetase